MGPDWYSLPRTSSDPEMNKHLQLLHTRHVWNSKKHWRKSTLSLPTYSQIVSRCQPFIRSWSSNAHVLQGTLVEGRSHSAGKVREGPSLVKELLQAEHSSKQLTKRYDALQAVRQNRKVGSRGHGIRKRK